MQISSKNKLKANHNQETTIVSQHISKAEEGGSRHTANLFEITVSDFDGALKSIRESELDYTADPETSTIQLLDFQADWYDSVAHAKKLATFVSKLDSDGIKHTTKALPVESRLIEAGTEAEYGRESIIKNIEREDELLKGGTVLRDAIQEAINRDREFVRQQQHNYIAYDRDGNIVGSSASKDKITTEHPNATVEVNQYANLREEQERLHQNGEELPDKDLKKLTDLYDLLLPHTEQTFVNAQEGYEKAKAEIEKVGSSLMKGKGFMSPFSLKRPSRAAEKTLRWYKGKAHWLGDGARVNLIVYNEADIAPIYEKVREVFGGGEMRYEPDKTDLGYPKKLLEVRTSNGRIAEYQVMTPQGYLAKDGVKEFIESKQGLAKDELAKIRKALGFDIPDGAGHYFYEINRDPNVPKSLRDEAKRLSLQYYDAMLKPSESTLDGDTFRGDVATFKDKVDAADKSKWDKSNKGKAPETVQEFIDKGNEPPTIDARNNRAQFSRKAKEANAIAKDKGFDSATHLLNSVKKRTGEEYKTVQDIPQKTLDKVVAERGKEKGSAEGAEQKILEQQVSDFGVNEKMVKPVSTMINTMFETAKKAGYSIGQTFKDWLKGGIGKGSEKP